MIRRFGFEDLRIGELELFDEVLVDGDKNEVIAYINEEKNDIWKFLKIRTI